eukprot:scaffold7381_cov310-Pinguiococcus_pyrenoidosus.AAC.87
MRLLVSLQLPVLPVSAAQQQRFRQTGALSSSTTTHVQEGSSECLSRPLTCIAELYRALRSTGQRSRHHHQRKCSEPGWSVSRKILTAKKTPYNVAMTPPSVLRDVRSEEALPRNPSSHSAYLLSFQPDR